MAAYNALFVSESVLKTFTAIHASVSPTDLVPAVFQAQDLILHELLGSTFYRQLQDQIVNNTVTAANRTILDNYIQPMLCNYAMAFALPNLTYRVYQKSVLKPGSESSQQIGLDELKFLIQNAKDVAENYAKQLQTYLKNNSSLYPAYANYALADGMAPNKKSPYFCGIQTNSKYYNRNRAKNMRDGLGQQNNEQTDFDCCE